MKRPSKIEIWIALAKMFSQRSTCSRLQVGVVIASEDLERVYSVGYNGGARGQKNACESTDPGMCGHLHAEINALLKCQVNDPKKVMFITHLPCPICAKAIVNSRFSKVIYLEDYRLDTAKQILKKANIEIEQIEADTI